LIAATIWRCADVRIVRVTAHAFGPLAGDTLELAEGLTVIYGPNESAKSSWHAALYAALCGRRRVASGDEKEFADRHRPWDRAEWEVSAEVVLADGRRVELRHDLAGKVACYAKDLDLVADYSKEITGIEKGEVPDASRWLGLDRRAFLATACVRQADLLSVTEQAGGIREHLQRAAATAGADATAAAALAELTRFQSIRVGSAQTRTKPLQAAEHGDVAARQALAIAREHQAELERRTVQARELREAAESLRVRLHGQETAQAHADAIRLEADAERLHRRATEATELTATLAAPVAEDPPAAPIAAALATWESLPAAPASTAQSTVDSAARARRQSTLMLVGGVALILFSVYLFVAGLVGPAAAAAGAGVTAAAIGLFLSGRASARHRALAVAEVGRHEERGRWDAAAERASAQVVAAATMIGLGTVEPAVALPSLHAWLADEPTRAARREQRVVWRSRLVDLLDGGVLADLQRRADEARAQATRARHALPSNSGEGVDTGVGVVGATGLRQEHEEADRRALLAEKDLAEYASSHTSVADAEERALAAAAELTRVRELDRILTLTKTYLTRAQERVHRDIAPRLAGALRRDLAAITADRYTDAVVDPASLVVQVRGAGGRLRDADRLSLGTAEQVYLLLRVALAEQLVKPGESCPLLLDDVTAHADHDRTEQMLRLLLGVAARHQVVLFTQQEQVRDWAKVHLDGDHHALRELTTVASV
jgi:uncharacterized protein YhaN